jgi:hypothetical protein
MLSVFSRFGLRVFSRKVPNANNQEGDRPVVLHTLPVPASDRVSILPVPLQEHPDKGPPQPPVRPLRGALSNATTTIPRLISVAEIIKREYVKALESKRSPRLEGLHQYNEIGCLENLGLDLGGNTRDETDKTRADEIISALSSRNQYVALVFTLCFCTDI